jgi:hypothetical protein
MLRFPDPQKFNTFNTFNIFNTFAIFAKFDPALEHPTRTPRHAPRLGSFSERRLDVTSPSPSTLGEGAHRETGVEGAGGRGVRVS